MEAEKISVSRLIAKEKIISLNQAERWPRIFTIKSHAATVIAMKSSHVCVIPSDHRMLDRTCWPHALRNYMVWKLQRALFIVQRFANLIALTFGGRYL